MRIERGGTGGLYHLRFIIKLGVVSHPMPAQQTSYGRKIWECDICGCKLQLGNKSNHFKSEKHAKNLVRGDENGVFENIETLI